MVYIRPDERTGESRHAPGKDENPGKYQGMFERRASQGQCFTTPYLGTRECSAYFKLLDENAKSGTDLLKEDRDLGIMLYDIDFSDPKDLTPMFFRAKMTNGIIDVPSPDSLDILK